MAEQKIQYRRLAGATSLGNISQLWLADDHLLSIQRAGYTESYKRFYFRDIQSILVRRTSTGKVLNFVLGGLALIPLLIGVAVIVSASANGFGEDDWFAVIFASVFGVPLVVALFVNLFRGPTCVFQLKTAVQQEQVPALKRLRTAEKVLATIKPLIGQAQGTLSPEEIQMAATHAWDPGAIPMGAAPESAPPAEIPWIDPSLRHCSGRLHAIVFTLSIADALVTALNFVTNHVIRDVVGIVITVLVLGFVAAAIANQHRSNMGVRVKRLTWGLLCYSVAMLAVSFVYGFVLAFQHPDRSGHTISPYEDAFVMGLCIINVVAASVFGVLGLTQLRHHQRWQRVAPPPPPVMAT